MKVSLSDFEIQLGYFVKEIINAMPSPIHKFAVGAYFAAKTKAIEDFLLTMADKDNNIDIDEARKIIDAGFSASGDNISLPIQGIPMIGLDSVNLKISKEDINKFFEGFLNVKHS